MRICKPKYRATEPDSCDRLEGNSKSKISGNLSPFLSDSAFIISQSSEFPNLKALSKTYLKKCRQRIFKSHYMNAKIHFFYEKRAFFG